MNVGGVEAGTNFDVNAVTTVVALDQVGTTGSGDEAILAGEIATETEEDAETIENMTEDKEEDDATDRRRIKE